MSRNRTNQPSVAEIKKQRALSNLNPPDILKINKQLIDKGGAAYIIFNGKPSQVDPLTGNVKPIPVVKIGNKVGIESTIARRYSFITLDKLEQYADDAYYNKLMKQVKSNQQKSVPTSLNYDPISSFTNTQTVTEAPTENKKGLLTGLGLLALLFLL